MSSSIPPLFCPECESEYLATATECVDCRVPLVTEAALAEREVEELPPVSELVCVRAAAVGWAQALSDLLVEAGISHRIEAVRDDDDDDSLKKQPTSRLPYGVWVRGEDIDLARDIDARFMRSQIPDLGEDLGTEPSMGAPDDTCPACGDAFPANAAECPGCGLAIAFEE